MLKQVLIIEDNPEHYEQAKKSCDTLGLSGVGVNANGVPHARWIRDFEGVTRILVYIERLLSDDGPAEDENKIKPGELGILTDLYFPVGERDGAAYGELAPLGLLVMAECQRLNIPCVIVTAGYHHGSKYNQVCFAGRLMGWPEMVDSGSYSDAEEEAEKKNWDEGLCRLKELANKLEAG